MARARKANAFAGQGRESPCAGPQVFEKGSAALEPPHLRFRSGCGHVAPRRLLGVGPSSPARFSSREGSAEAEARAMLAGSCSLPGLAARRAASRESALAAARGLGALLCCDLSLAGIEEMAAAQLCSRFVVPGLSPCLPLWAR